MRKAFIFLALFNSLWISSPTQARTIGSHAGFTASAADNFPCADVINVRVDSKTKNGFENDRANFVKLVGLIRVVMGFECPKVKQINIAAYANGQMVGNTQVSKSSGWTLTPLKKTAANSGNKATRGGGKNVGRTGGNKTGRGGGRVIGQGGGVSTPGQTRSYSKNGVTARSKPYAQWVFYDRPAKYTVNKFQFPRDSNLTTLLNVFGADVEDVSFFAYDGVKQSPFKNPTSKHQRYFNQQLAKGGYRLKHPDNQKLYKPRIKSVVPGGMFDQIGVEAGNYIQRFNSPKANIRNSGPTGARSLNILIHDLLWWRKNKPNQNYELEILIAKFGHRDVHLEAYVSIPPAALAKFSQPHQRKTGTHFVNLLPQPKAIKGRKITYPKGIGERLIRYVTNGSYDRYVFWKLEKNDLLDEGMLDLMFPGAIEAYSDVCKSSLKDPVKFTQMHTVQTDQVGQYGVPYSVITRYYKQIEGKTVYMERDYLSLFHKKRTSALKAIYDIYKNPAFHSDQGLVPFNYEAFRKIAARTQEMREFFKSNGCVPVGRTFMKNLAFLLSGQRLTVDRGKYPGKVQVFPIGETHYYAFVPPGGRPKITPLKETIAFTAQFIGSRSVPGKLAGFSFSVSELYSPQNPKFKGNSQSMKDARSEVFSSGSLGLKCDYHGKPSRFFWYRKRDGLSHPTLNVMAKVVETSRQTCPATYAVN